MTNPPKCRDGPLTTPLESLLPPGADEGRIQLMESSHLRWNRSHSRCRSKEVTQAWEIFTNILYSLESLALKLISSGPHKVEATPRRVRALFGGVWLFDTISARHVWEYQYYPQFWVPISSFAPSVLTKGKAIDSNGSAFLGVVKGNTKSTDRVLIFEKGPLEGLVRVEFKAIGKCCGCHFQNVLSRLMNIRWVARGRPTYLWPS